VFVTLNSHLLTQSSTQTVFVFHSILTRHVNISAIAGPSTQHNGGCKLHPNQTKVGELRGKGFGRQQVYDTTSHCMTNKRVTNNNKLGVMISWTAPGMKNFVAIGSGVSVPQIRDFAVLLG